MFDKENFETQVQHKLQEMDLRPSSAVWDKIEAQLPPERRWRGGFLWGTLLVAAMAAGGYFFFLNNNTVSYKINNSTLSGNTPGVATTDNKSENGSSAAGDKLVNPGSDTALTDHLTASGTDVGASPSASTVDESSLSVKTQGVSKAAGAGEPAVQSESATVKPVAKARIAGNTMFSGNVTTASGTTRQDIAGNYNRRSGSNQKNIKDKSSRIKNPDMASPVINAEMTAAEGTDGMQQAIPLADRTPREAVPEPTVVDTHVIYHEGYLVTSDVKSIAEPRQDAIANVAKGISAANKKWSLEIGGSVGQSIYSAGKVNKLFRAADQVVVNPINSMAGQTPITSTNPTAFSSAYYPPSEVKPGRSFSLGADVGYRLHKRITVTAGVYYNLLTTKIETGSKTKRKTKVQMNGRQREIEEYYASGYMNEYTNKYHFIEIPIAFHFQLNEGRKLPLYFNAGMSYARLLKTNSLHYDAESYIYYKASDLVKKDFLNIEGGISARVFPGRKFSFIIGPEIQYGLTNLFNNNVQQKDKHSLFLGIKAAVPLNL